MAVGDVHWFAQGLHDLANKLHDIDTDDIRVGLVTSAVAPSITTAAPHWGGAGTTNFAANQVGTGGTSYTGPIALATETWQITAGVVEFKADKIALAQDASGPTNIAYGIIFNNTDANKRCLGYVEISAAGAGSLVAGPIEIRWNGVDGNGRVLSLTPA